MSYLIILFFAIQNIPAPTSALIFPILEKTVPYIHKMDLFLENHPDKDLLKHFAKDEFLYNMAIKLEDLSLQILIYYILSSRKEMYKSELSFFKQSGTEQSLSFLNDFLKTGEIGLIETNNSENSVLWETALNIQLPEIKKIMFSHIEIDKEYSKMSDFKKFNIFYSKYAENPIPLNAVNDISEIAHFKKLFERINEDKSIIKYILGINNNEPLYLYNMKINASDRHKYGGGVTTMTFVTGEDNRDEIKLVYKTGPIRPDLLLTGDIGFYDKLFGAIEDESKKKLKRYTIKQSYFEILNEGFENTYGVKNYTQLYKVVPIELDLSEEPLTLENYYGYIEFIEGDILNEFKYIERMDKKNMSKQVYDSIAYQLGYLEASLENISANDLHGENIIIK